MFKNIHEFKPFICESKNGKANKEWSKMREKYRKKDIYMTSINRSYVLPLQLQSTFTPSSSERNRVIWTEKKLKTSLSMQSGADSIIFPGGGKISMSHQKQH